jgi:hypothetical protein
MYTTPGRQVRVQFVYLACVENLRVVNHRYRLSLAFSQTGMNQSWEECVNTRFSRMEGSIATMASQMFTGLSVHASSMADMHRVVLQIRSQLATMELNRVGPQCMPMSPGLMSTLPLLCVFCGVSARRITATSSLRHMFSCTSCPPNVCRYLSITEHMLTFKNAPLIGSPERCCWCGLGWSDCKGNSLSPDARSKHKKLCHQATLDKLRSSDPLVQNETRIYLHSQWCVPGVPEVDEGETKVKRARDDGRIVPALFIISEPECQENHSPRAESPEFIIPFSDCGD